MLAESYADPCPKCGARLLGYSKEDFVEHLRENGEELAAKIHEQMVVSAQNSETEADCAGANGDSHA